MKYKVLIADEAINDMVSLIQYMRVDLCNPSAADKLMAGLQETIAELEYFPEKYGESGITYRNYKIHKKVYQSYLLFYIINSKDKTISILRILKDIMNWPGILRETKIYHFSKYKSKKKK